MTALLLALTIAAGAPAGGGYGYEPLQQIGDESVEVVERLGEPIPAGLRFYDAFHNQVALKDFLGQGKPAVLTLVYFECPMLCSLVLKGLIKGLNETGLQLGQDYQGITVSFDPKDTPRTAAEAQRGYLAGVRGLDRARAQDWPFLTGGEANARAHPAVRPSSGGLRAHARGAHLEIPVRHRVPRPRSAARAGRGERREGRDQLRPRAAQVLPV